MAEISRGIHYVILTAAFVLYTLGARALWKSGGWPARATYLVGGALLAYYEIHMRVLWFASGMAAIVLARMLPNKPSDDNSQGG